MNVPSTPLPPSMPSSPALDTLRAQIARIEEAGKPVRGLLPFGIPAIDTVLPGGGVRLGALHEVAGGGAGVVDGAAAALFAGGIVARVPGLVLWCMARMDLFAPALAQVGLDPDRVIYAEAGDELAVLACFEEGLRHGGLAGVVGEVARLSMTVSRRLHLAAEASGTIGIAVRRWRRPADAVDFGQPTAAVTRWRVTAMPSEPLPVPGVGRGRWRLELLRARAGECAEFVVDACDATGHLALPADLADRSAAARDGQRRTSA